MLRAFSNEAIEKLMYYVYVYSDPDTKEPFYVGKGKGNRVFNHLTDQSETEKVAKIKEILDKGKEPLMEILAHGLDEDTAFKVEAAAIDLIGINHLTNQIRGHKSGEYGKIEVSMLDARYNAESISLEEIRHNVMMIRINNLYRNDLTEVELYDITRGYWRLNPKQAEKVEYVLAVYFGMVVEVYKPILWLPALSTYTTRKDVNPDFAKTRYEFVGKVAEDSIRKNYFNKSVKDLFSPGEQNPIKYIWRKDSKKA